MNLLRLCAHPAAKMCTLELLDLLALHNMKGRVHAVNRKLQAKKEQKRQARTLFDLSLKRVKDIPTSTPAAAGSLARKNLKAPSPVVVVQKTLQGLGTEAYTSSPMVPGQAGMRTRMGVVDSEKRVMGLDTAVHCTFEGCETSWVRCLN